VAEPQRVSPEPLIADPWDLVEEGHYDEALPHLRAEAEEAERVCGPDSFDAAVAWNRVGVASKFAGRYDDAEAAYARALPAAEALVDAEPDLLAALLHNLGGLAHSRHRPDVAEPFARRGLTLRRTRCDDPIGVAADTAALAAILETLERWDEAETLYREALGFYEDVGDRYEAAMTLNGLAAVLRFRGRESEAEPAFRRALTMMEAERGPAHPETATVRNNLAMLLNATGRPAEALGLLQDARRDLTDVLGAAHPATRDIAANLSRVETHVRTGRDPGPSSPSQ
jgi:tetratricopeptide (TPR) repeat protein